jgi:hypothetical protein
MGGNERVVQPKGVTIVVLVHSNAPRQGRSIMYSISTSLRRLVATNGLPPNRVGIQKRKRREKEKERREEGKISSCLCTQNNSLFILCNAVKSSPFFGEFYEKISRFARHCLAVL